MGEPPPEEPVAAEGERERPGITKVPAVRRWSIGCERASQRRYEKVNGLGAHVARDGIGMELVAALPEVGGRRRRVAGSRIGERAVDRLPPCSNRGHDESRNLSRHHSSASRCVEWRRCELVPWS